MSKIKIYELAKELQVTSKEVIELLGKKNIEVKSHMSSIDDTEADQIRGSILKEEKPAEKKSEEAQKKKNIVHVFRPQNTQKGVRQGGNRQKGKGGHTPGKPMQVNNGRPSKAAPVSKPEPAIRKTVEKPEP